MAAPVITSLNPSSAPVGSADFTLHVIGTGFQSGASIAVQGENQPTTFVSATELTTTVKPSKTAIPATYSLSVTQPSGTSNAVNFTYTANSDLYTGLKHCFSMCNVAAACVLPTPWPKPT